MEEVGESIVYKLIMPGVGCVAMSKVWNKWEAEDEAQRLCDLYDYRGLKIYKIHVNVTECSTWYPSYNRIKNTSSTYLK